MEAFISAASGFLLFHLTSHPKSKINKKLPAKKIHNRVQVFPRVNFEAKNRVFHFHHWMLFVPAFVFFNFFYKITHLELLNGFMIGSIVQGLLYKDRFRMVHKAKDYNYKVKKTSYNLSFLRKLV